MGCAGCAASKPSVGAAPISESSAPPIADPKAIQQLDEGERVLTVAGSDCGAACRGLGQISKARLALCTPRTSACADAEKREGAAIQHIAGTCEPCP